MNEPLNVTDYEALARARLDGDLRLLCGSRVVDEVDGKVDVLMDGGVRRGTDVLKALALGARAVLVGRPYLWGLQIGT